MCKSRLWVCLGVGLSVFSPAFADFGTAFSFHAFTGGGAYASKEGSRFDNGGTMYMFIHNYSGSAQTISSVLLNGTNADTLVSNGTLKWWQPTQWTIPNGEMITLSFKANGAPLQQGSSVSVQVNFTSGQSLYRTYDYLDSPLIRIAHVVPSADMQTLYIFLRNNSSNTGWTLDNVLFDAVNVNGQTAYVGGNWIGAGQVKIIKVSFAQPLVVGKRHVLRIGTTAGYWTNSPIMIFEPDFVVGNWGSDLWYNHDAMQAARRLQINTNYNDGDINQANWAWQYYGLKSMVMVTQSSGINTAFVQQNTNNPAVRFWYIRDEPEGDYSSNQCKNWNQDYWQNGGNKPTLLNLHAQRYFGEFGTISDIAAEDHYCAFNAPNVIPNTWFTRYAYFDESYDYAEQLKWNTEPRPMYNWTQLAASGTWGTQPKNWQVKYQFWANIMSGAKGIKWFKYGSGYENSFQTQFLAAEDCAKQLNQIRELLVYGEPRVGQPLRSTTDVKGRVIDSEEAVVLVLLNDKISYSGTWWSPNVTISSVSGDVKVNVPSYIPIQAVRQVHASGFGTPSHSISGSEVTINFSSTGDPMIYVIGKNDTVRPTSPGDLGPVRDLGSNNWVFSWKPARDNYGIYQYRVHKNGSLLHTTRETYTTINMSGNDVIEVYAEDSFGNISLTPAYYSNAMLPNGTYRIVNLHSGKCVDVEGAYQHDGANIHQWNYVGGANQKWWISDVGDGYQGLTAIHSGKVADVTGSSGDDGANIQQWTWNGTNAQRWKIRNIGNGVYRIEARNSGKVMEVAGGATHNGANIQQKTWSDQNWQKWLILPPYSTLENLAEMGENWLRQDCGATNYWCDGADWDTDGKVDLFDFAKLAIVWE